MKPAGVKEWDSPTYLERLKHFLADHGPQTGTGRPTLGGERVASGVQRVLELLPVTGNIESGQRAYRDFKRGDNIEGALNSLGALMPLNAYSQVAHGATPMVRAGNAAMLLPNTIPSDENALLPERKDGGSVNDDVSHALRIAHDEVNHYGGGGGAKITAKLLEELQSGLGKLFAPGSGYVPVPTNLQLSKFQQLERLKRDQLKALNALRIGICGRLGVKVSMKSMLFLNLTLNAHGKLPKHMKICCMTQHTLK